MRVFFALPLPDAVRDAVAEALSPVRAAGPQVGWERRSNLHITLRFLGDVRAEQIDGICASISPWVRRLPPPALVLGGGGAFPDAHQPRVLWIGVGPAGCLSPLVQAMSDCLAPFGIPPEERSYSAHLTVGRVRGERAGRVATALLEVGEVARFVPDRAVLYESISGPDGPRYRPIRVFPTS